MVDVISTCMVQPASLKPLFGGFEKTGEKALMGSLMGGEAFFSFLVTTSSLPCWCHGRRARVDLLLEQVYPLGHMSDVTGSLGQ